MLRQAKVDTARAVIVTCHRDDTATLVTLTARELNPTAVIAAGVRETENAHLLRQSGASTVIVSSEASGRMLGLATDAPSAVGVLEDLLIMGSGLDLSERPAEASEIGGPPQATPGTIPIAIVRDGTSISFHDEPTSNGSRAAMSSCASGHERLRAEHRRLTIPQGSGMGAARRPLHHEEVTPTSR